MGLLFLLLLVADPLHLHCISNVINAKAPTLTPDRKGAAELASKVCAFGVWLTLLGNELGYATRSIVRKCHSARSTGQALGQLSSSAVGQLGSWEAKIHSTNCQTLNFPLVSVGTLSLSHSPCLVCLSVRFLRVVALIN